MADLSTIKTEINTNIVTNGTNSITGDIMNDVLIDMCDAVENALTTTETTTSNQMDAVSEQGNNFSVVIEGQGTTWVKHAFTALEGCTYLITFPDGYWTMPVSGNTQVFNIYYIDENNAYQAEKKFTVTQLTWEAFSFVAKANKGYEIWARITSGTDATFNIMQLDSQLELCREADGAVNIVTANNKYQNIEIPANVFRLVGKGFTPKTISSAVSLNTTNAQAIMAVCYNSKTAAWSIVAPANLIYAPAWVHVVFYYGYSYKWCSLPADMVQWDSEGTWKDNTDANINTLQNSVNLIVQQQTEIGTYNNTSYFSEYFHFKKGKTYIISTGQGSASTSTGYVTANYGNLNTSMAIELDVAFTPDQDYYYAYKDHINTRPYTFVIGEGYNLQNTIEDIYGQIGVNSDIVSLNNPKETELKFKQLTKTIYADGGTDSGVKQLVLLHFSDIHSNSSNFDRIIDYYNAYSNYIDDVIHTGDCVGGNWSSDFTFWSGATGADTILNTIGNHDTAYYTADDGFDWTYYQGLQAYNRYFAPFISNWGVTQPTDAATNGYCYYYKDYATANVRLIVMDCMADVKAGGTDATQLQWFESVLADAKTQGIHVVGAYHYARIDTAIECAFTNVYKKTNPTTMPVDYMNAVDAFIENGGSFVCWISGHTHRDYFGTYTGATYGHKIATIVVDTAAATSQPKFSDIARDYGYKSYDLFNIFSVDTYRKRFSVFRVGSDFDMMMHHIGSISFDYENEILLSNY